MQDKITRILILLLLLISVTSCSLVEGIFKAGMGVGIFIVVIILAVFAFIISKIVGKK
ncbi:hypothetical protein [Flavobacterium cellulosilyticum]|uniref:hypothetical protein n=1 Tax=Flavobacterium cellulosilyticum TaxID=2541731 RepID=UPI0014053D57|nr:hypothetical protein [Flavobacterium cellulosilyticum]